MSTHKRTVSVYDYKKVVIICYTIRRLVRSDIDPQATEIDASITSKKVIL